SLEWASRRVLQLNVLVAVVPAVGNSQFGPFPTQHDAGWSSPVARWAHNPKVGGSNPPPATNFTDRIRARPLSLRGGKHRPQIPDNFQQHNIEFALLLLDLSEEAFDVGDVRHV